MLLHKSADPIQRDRIRLRRLPLGLVVGLLTVTVMAIAQTPEPEVPKEQQLPATAQEESLETESGARGCPCCGRQDGVQGSGRGCQGTGTGRGHGCRGCGRGQGTGGQMRGAGRPEAQVIHFLVDNHESLERTVENIPGGVLTRTVSNDPEIIDALRTHVRQMVDLIHGGGRIRNWDPLFREIFDHREAIEMNITDIDGGVEVTETSDDDQIAKLIRAHAVKVEEFVARGQAAYKEETPLPEDYSETRP